MKNYTHTLNEGFDSYFKKLNESSDISGDYQIKMSLGNTVYFDKGICYDENTDEEIEVISATVYNDILKDELVSPEIEIGDYISEDEIEDDDYTIISSGNDENDYKVLYDRIITSYDMEEALWDSILYIIPFDFEIIDGSVKKDTMTLKFDTVEQADRALEIYTSNGISGHKEEDDIVIISDFFGSDNINESLKESVNAYQLNRDDVVDWFYVHEQLLDDVTRKFNKDIENIPLEDLVDWIGEHGGQLQSDFERFFDCSLDESLADELNGSIKRNKKLDESYKDYKFIENLYHQYLILISSLKKEIYNFESYIKNTDPSGYSARNIKRQLSSMFNILHGISEQNNKIGFSDQKDKRVDLDIKEKIDRLLSIKDTRTARKTPLETILHYVYNVYKQTLEDYPPSKINDLYSRVYRTIIEIGDTEAAEKFGIDLDNINSSK